MILKTLVLQNFGTYSGVQSLNLEPADGKTVILVGGKNGAGKSTLLEAIRLCLYGAQSSRMPLSRERYERYLLERIHRDSTSSVPTSNASVAIEFSYADEAGLKTYLATRSWERNAKGSVDETFALLVNGTAVSEIDSGHWQDFIQELMPMGVSDLFFFDGELIQLLAEDGSDTKTLSEAVSNLLGVDIVEKLSADLTIFKSRLVAKTDSDAKGTSELDLLQDAITQLKSQYAESEAAFASAGEEAKGAIARVQELERTLQERGGAYARNRGRLEEKKRQLSSRVTTLENSIRDQAHGLLPTALAPKLMRALLKQLDREEDVRFGVVVDETLGDAAKKTIARLRRMNIQTGSKQQQLGNLREFTQIIEAIKHAHEPKLWHNDSIVHDLSKNQEQQVRSWAAASLDSLPSTLASLSSELESLYRDTQKVERDLARVPSDEVLVPLLESLDEARREASEKQLSVGQMSAAVQELNTKLVEAEAAYSKRIEHIAAGHTKQESINRATLVQDVLADFRATLISTKIKEVESQVTECFNLLSRKKIRRRIEINPVNFEVSLRDSNGRILDKNELSAGERQIYAISVLWALAKVSGRPLPMIIDTPLARLDRDHRHLLGTEYFPRASHQVIILSTDSEIDSQMLPLLDNNIAQRYELQFDPKKQSTQILSGYFGETEITA